MKTNEIEVGKQVYFNEDAINSLSKEYESFFYKQLTVTRYQKYKNQLYLFDLIDPDGNKKTITCDYDFIIRFITST